MEETINDSHREGPPSGGFVMESAIRIPSGLHLDSGRTCSGTQANRTRSFASTRPRKRSWG
jgi:hypothetical protein